jgi:Cof subfamily protein (haloacid dehalogenase superfamily)
VAIKAVFFDFDGTLYSHTQHRVPASTVKAIDALQKQGIACVLATGRHVSELKDLHFDLSLDAWITLNGQLCFKGDHYFRKKELHGAASLQKQFDAMQVPLMFVEEKRLYVSFINDQVRQAHKAISTPLPPVGRWNGAPVYMALAYMNAQQAEHVQLDGFKVTRWNQDAVDIVPPDVSKVAGIKAYCDLHHIKKEETMAFGDGENDMEMLRWAGTGIAMGQADGIVKQCADDVCEDIDHDGIPHALMRYGSGRD